MTRSERDRAHDEAAYQAQEWTPVLRAIEAMPDGQAEIFPLAEKLYPAPTGPRGYVDGRTRAARQWHRHKMAVIRVWTDLIEAGMVEIIIPADGMHPDLFRVSEAGRRWLAEHGVLTSGDALP